MSSAEDSIVVQIWYNRPIGNSGFNRRLMAGQRQNRRNARRLSVLLVTSGEASMNRRDFVRLSFALLVLSCVSKFASAQFVWEGDVSSDAADPANWNTNSIPDGTSNVEFRTGTNGVVDVSGDATWNTIFFNSAGPTTINGSGTITLNGTGVTNSISSAGGPLSSTINPHIVTPARIQTNGNHDVTFNGNVTATKIEAFASTAVYNGSVTASDGFLTVGNSGKVVFNGNFHWSRASQLELGINGGNSDITFTSLSSDFNPIGVNLINMFDSATVRMSRPFVFGTESDLWSRRGTNVLDMQGFDENVEFIGTDAAGSGNTDVDAIMTIDFGATPGMNTLIWQASHNMGGQYQVRNFEIATDILELGAAGPQFFTDDQLSRIRINGIPYSATDPGNGSAYWNRNNLLQPQFFNLDAIALPGDYNEDGFVNAADYVIWRKHLRMDFALPNRGPGNSGPVSDSDYNTWRANFGASGSGGLNVGAVPEPTSVLLLAVGALVVAMRRVQQEVL
jgi:hypothetical protein